MAEESLQYPLRKIIEVVRIPGEKFGWPDVFKERLECGHIVRIKQDIYGPTNAYRRRCRECARTPVQEVDRG